MIESVWTEEVNNNPVTEQVDPNLANDLTERLEPNWTKSKIDVLPVAPSWKFVLTLSIDPKALESKIETMSPAFIIPWTEN
jgi:hypothetical protein